MFIRLAVSFAVILSTVPFGLAKDKDPLDFDRKRMEIILDNVSKDVAKSYFDPSLKGLDWTALTEEARRKIGSAGSVDEMLTAISGLVGALKDSHTVFIPPAWTMQPIFGFEARPVGDGIRVVRIKKGKPAEAAGLKLGDRILAVNGFGAVKATYNRMMMYFYNLRPVKRLEVVVQREGGAQQTIVIDALVKPHARTESYEDAIERLSREADDEQAEVNEEDPFAWRRNGDGTGCVRFPEFLGSALADGFIDRLIKKVRDSRAIVIDLRGNPGGAIETLRLLAGHFQMDAGSMYEAAGRKGTRPVEVVPESPNITVPLVVLVDGGSASAAEIFARHVQRTGRGIVVGDVTAGAVRIARYHPMSVGGNTQVGYAVNVTEARVLFPGGEDIEGVGVMPDRICLPTEADLREGRDPCLDVALALAREKAGRANP